MTPTNTSHPSKRPKPASVVRASTKQPRSSTTTATTNTTYNSNDDDSTFVADPPIPPFEYILQLALEKQDANACLLIAQFYSTAPLNDGRNIKKALEFWEEAGRVGSAQGAKMAAMVYRDEVGMRSSRDDDETGAFGLGGGAEVARCGWKAREWMRKAAEELGESACWLVSTSEKQVLLYLLVA
jgi:hypothetical protein